MGRPSLDLNGKHFGRLDVIARSEKVSRFSYWLCRCSCGKQKVIRGNLLVKGISQSCGCYASEAASVRNATHGHSKGYRTSPTYTSWRAMWSRVTNRNHVGFKRYGGRGITICARWKEFPNFLADMGPKPEPKLQIDRINNEGNYEPGNCRWATVKQQANNKTISDKCRNGHPRKPGERCVICQRNTLEKFRRLHPNYNIRSRVSA